MLRLCVGSLLAVVLCVPSAQAQTAWPGEDWETATPASQGMDAAALLAGGGIPGGVVHGASDRLAADPARDPATPGDLAATLFSRFGIDPHHRIARGDGEITPAGGLAAAALDKPAERGLPPCAVNRGCDRP